MPFYRITLHSGAPIIRQARTAVLAAEVGRRESGHEVRKVDAMEVAELADLARRGCFIPVGARQRVAAFNAKERAKVAEAKRRGATQAKAMRARQEALEAERERKKAARREAKEARERAKRQEKDKVTREANKLAKAGPPAGGEQEQRPVPVRVTTEMLLKGIKL